MYTSSADSHVLPMTVSHGKDILAFHLAYAMCRREWWKYMPVESLLYKLMGSHLIRKADVNTWLPVQDHCWLMQ